MSGESDKGRQNPTRRQVLKLGGGTAAAILAGGAAAQKDKIGGILEGSDSNDPGPAATETTEETPTETTTDTTETPAETGTETETVTPSETSVDAGEIYHETMSDLVDEVDVYVDEDQAIEDQVRDALIEGAKFGEWFGASYGLNDQHTATQLAAAAAVYQLDDFNRENGDIVNTLLTYSAGQEPAVQTKYTNQNGETIQDLLTPLGRRTDREAHLHTNWTTQRAGTTDDIFWDEGASNSHILDASGYESSFDHVDMDSYSESTTEQFSAIPYNSHEIDVDITVGGWDAWEAAEQKVTEGLAKDVYDDITELANQDDIDSFAFVYDKSEDSFEAAHVNEDFRENPFQYLEQPATETAS